MSSSIPTVVKENRSGDLGGYDGAGRLERKAVKEEVNGPE